MISIKQGIVQEIKRNSEAVQEIMVSIGVSLEKAINYPFIAGLAAKGDSVVLNTTAVELELGTGGYHFVIYNQSNPPQENVEKSGHIMKMRYTPMQIAVGSCEEQASPYHDLLQNNATIRRMPVLAGELHSMLPIIATYIKQKNEGLRVAYIMTDKAALPIALSHHVRQLQEKVWLCGTITIGQAFGGDLEAVNIYTALLAAKQILHADLAIVTMGPGIVGTGTPLGFSGMELVEILHAAYSLQGIPVLIPRTSQADQRKRHQGVSHHTLNVLQHTLVPVHIPVLEQLVSQLDGTRHHLHIGSEAALQDLEKTLQAYQPPIQTMGRGMKDDLQFFQSTALAADFGCFLAKKVSALDINGLSGEGDLLPLWKDWPIL